MTNNRTFQILIIALLILFSFCLGWLGSNLTGYTVYSENPSSIEQSSLNNNSNENNKAMPGNWIGEDKIRVYNDKVILDVKNAEWSRFTDTHSMEPVLGKYSNAIEIVPKNESEIKVGDIIVYESEQGLIVHRVIERGVDGAGVYFITKGDNNITPDSYKVRFSRIQRIVVGIIY